MENNNIDENTIIEINPTFENTLFDEQITEDVNENEIVIKKSKKNNKKNKDNKKIVVIIVSISLTIIIILGVLYFLYIKGAFNEKVIEKEKEPDVIIEKDNFIYKNGILEFIDNASKKIGSYECENKETSKCYIAYLSNEDDFDIPKYVLERTDDKFDRSSKIYDNNFVFIQDGDVIKLYDIKKTTIIGEYKLIKTGAGKQSLLVTKNSQDKYGILNIENNKVNYVLDNEYDYLGILESNEVFVAVTGGKQYLINNEGKAISSKIDGNIKKFSEKYIVVYNDGVYRLCNYQGINLLPDTYDFIDLNDKYIFLINNKKLTILDNNYKKVNEDAIKLVNDEYVTKYIFDDEFNIKETVKSYEVSYKPGSIVVNVTDAGEIIINLYENSLNSQNEYVNYINGYLYFYKDAEKTKLIGKYKCNSINSVGADTKAFANCFIAKDSSIMNEKSNGYIPIINENYAFILDNNIIVLYDLTKNKSLAKYKMVDTGISMDHIAHVTSKDSLIFAQNTEDYYGAISFNDGPKNIIQFKYCVKKDGDVCSEYDYTSSIEKLDKYFLVKRTKENYLYDETGKVLGHSTFNIISYEEPYMVVKDNGYIIYNNGKIASESMDYVALDKNYYVGIKDNKLNIYSYDKTSLLEESLDMHVANYKEGYRIENFSDGHNIIIITKENTEEIHKYNLDWSKVVEKSEVVEEENKTEVEENKETENSKEEKGGETLEG